MTTRPLPLEAEIFTRKGERFARWKDSKGKTRTEALTIGKDGRDRVVAVSPYFIAKYRDGSGLVVEQSTACRDETAARKVPADWGVERNRLSSNPFAAVPKAIVKADPRRTRRAMVETELVKLLDAAQRRPLRDDAAKDRPDIWERRKLAGRERALIYKTLVLTGLRKGELTSLTVGQMDLDGPAAYAVLNAADEKNREGSEIPIRADLAADLRQWLSDKLARLQAEAIRKGEPMPSRLPPDTLVLRVPMK